MKILLTEEDIRDALISTVQEKTKGCVGSCDDIDFKIVAEEATEEGEVIIYRSLSAYVPLVTD